MAACLRNPVPCFITGPKGQATLLLFVAWLAAWFLLGQEGPSVCWEASSSCRLIAAHDIRCLAGTVFSFPRCGL